MRTPAGSDLLSSVYPLRVPWIQARPGPWIQVMRNCQKLRGPATARESTSPQSLVCLGIRDKSVNQRKFPSPRDFLGRLNRFSESPVYLRPNKETQSLVKYTHRKESTTMQKCHLPILRVDSIFFILSTLWQWWWLWRLRRRCAGG